MATNNNKKEEIGLDTELIKSGAFIEKHLKKIVIALIAVIVVVIGFFIYNNHMEGVEKEAQEAISKCQTSFYQQQYEVSLNGDSLKTFKGMLDIIKDYPGTKTANIAKVYAGLCYYNMGEYDKAINMLEDYDVQDDKSISLSVTAALGDCYIHKGNNEKGIEKLMEAANDADNVLSALFMFKAAKVYESMNQKEKALELYKNIKSKYPESSVATNIDKYIERVN